MTITTTRIPSRHAEIIKAWADGYQIEYKGPHCDQWRDILPAGQSSVSWQDDVEYRIKLEPVTWFAGIRNVNGVPFFTHPQATEEAVRRAWGTDVTFRQVVKLQISQQDGNLLSIEIVSAEQADAVQEAPTLVLNSTVPPSFWGDTPME